MNDYGRNDYPMPDEDEQAYESRRWALEEEQAQDDADDYHSNLGC